MTREEALEILAAHRHKLRDYAVKSLAIFGSTARGEATDASDIDVLVEFDEGRPVGLFQFVRLQRFLAEILGRPVDLATPEAIRAEMREQVLKEAIRAA